MDDIENLFYNNKLLVRGMNDPFLIRKNDDFFYDFSEWANEIEMASNEGLYNLSTTLIIPGEEVPTYKPIGFLINSTKSKIEHIARSDSGSNGSFKSGTFTASYTDLSTLDELASDISLNNSRIMNEVNIEIKNDAIIGLFFNKSLSSRGLSNVTLAQKCIEMQTGNVLPIYMYDTKNGTLNNIEILDINKDDFINNNSLKTTNIFYETDMLDSKTNNYFDIIESKKNRL